MRNQVSKRAGSPGRRSRAVDARVIALHRIIRDKWNARHDGPAGCRRNMARECMPLLEQQMEERQQYSLTLGDVAYIINLERTHCSRVFSEIAGGSYSAWIRRMRIGKARRLLVATTCSITEIAHIVGYSDVTTFERSFRKETGMSPMSFRQMSRMPGAEVQGLNGQLASPLSQPELHAQDPIAAQ